LPAFFFNPLHRLSSIIPEIFYFDLTVTFKEIFDSLKPGGILSMTESIFNHHFQGRNTVARLAAAYAFREKAFYGNCTAFTMNLEKPLD